MFIFTPAVSVPEGATFRMLWFVFWPLLAGSAAGIAGIVADDLGGPSWAFAAGLVTMVVLDIWFLARCVALTLGWVPESFRE